MPGWPFVAGRGCGGGGLVVCGYSDVNSPASIGFFFHIRSRVCLGLYFSLIHVLHLLLITFVLLFF